MRVTPKGQVVTPEAIKKAHELRSWECQLQAGAVLMTNDRHFTRIGKERIVDVRTIAEAIPELLGSSE
jgi:hypothetical protein